MTNVNFFNGRKASVKILFLFLIALPIAGCDLHNCKIFEGKWAIQGEALFGDWPILINETTIDTATVNWLGDDNETIIGKTLLYYNSDVNMYVMGVGFGVNILIYPKTVTKNDFQGVITGEEGTDPIIGIKIED
jgi:hypothetical protein